MFVRNSALLPLKRTKPIPGVQGWEVVEDPESRYTLLFLQISPPLIITFNLNSSNWKQNAERDLKRIISDAQIRILETQIRDDMFSSLECMCTGGEEVE